jgi:hypothetical protein
VWTTPALQGESDVRLAVGVDQTGVPKTPKNQTRASITEEKLKAIAQVLAS